LCRDFGRRRLLLDPCSAACLASSSATLFPTDSMCPATHVNEISIFRGLLSSDRSLLANSSVWSASTSRFILLIRYWAGCGSLLASVLIVAWLLMLKLIRVQDPLIEQVRCSPRIIPTNSPSKTVCSMSGPSQYHSSAVLLPLVNSIANAAT